VKDLGGATHKHNILFLNFKRLGVERFKRGSVSVETAVVLIAFIIVAASFAFIVLNMGFFASQKSKSTFGEGLRTTAMTIEVSGDVMGYCRGTDSVTEIIIPLRLSLNAEMFDFSTDNVAVEFITGNKTYANIYAGRLDVSSISLNDILDAAYTAAAGSTKAYTVWIMDKDGDTVLEKGERVLLIIVLGPNDYVDVGERFKVEIVPVKGVTLTVERSVTYAVVGEFVDLG